MFWLLLISTLAFQALAETSEYTPALEHLAAPFEEDFNIDPNDIYFYMVTRSNRNPTRINIFDLDRVNIDERNPVKFIIHGWTESIRSFWYAPIMDAYLLSRDVTIFALDWNEHALANYINSVRAVRQIGDIVGFFIQQLNQRKGISLDNVHLVGHSLGAQMSGFSGKSVLSRTGRRVARVTGLDPAGPLFNLNTADRRIDSGDANFVDIIHTDGNSLGMGRDVGHADFYPNGGTAIQSGCLYVVCSHNRAPRYFIESITRRDNFIGRECRNNYNFVTGLCRRNAVAVMGEHASSSTRGSFYLSTRSFSPYGRGNNGT